MRAALYARVSTSEQENENQLVQLRQFAALLGWQIETEYSDKASGGTNNRTEFKRMFEDASQRRFDVLLFWSLDRLSREGVLETLQHLQRLTSYGIAWRSFTEQYLDSTGIFRDAVIGILAAIAKQERIRRSERTMAGLQRARKKGSTLGRPRVTVDHDLIRRLRIAGRSWTEIATATGLTRSTVQRAYCAAGESHAQ